MSTIRNKMSQKDRAKQFAPFAALKGHDEALAKYSRFQEEKIELAEDEAVIMNEILASLQKGDNIIVTYYISGCYTILSGSVEKIYQYENQIAIGGQIINFEDIYRIEKRGV